MSEIGTIPFAESQFHAPSSVIPVVRPVRTPEVGKLVRAELPPYNVRFLDAKPLRDFEAFFNSLPFDEDLLASQFEAYQGSRDKPLVEKGQVMGALGELVVSGAINRAIQEVPGVHPFPASKRVGNLEISLDNPIIGNYNIDKICIGKDGRLVKRRKGEKDGLFLVEDEATGQKSPVIVHSKVRRATSGHGDLNELLGPTTARAQVQPLIDLFGGRVGNIAAVTEDNLSSGHARSTALQDHFRANGGILISPFTYDQIDSLATRLLPQSA